MVGQSRFWPPRGSRRWPGAPWRASTWAMVMLRLGALAGTSSTRSISRVSPCMSWAAARPEAAARVASRMLRDRRCMATLPRVWRTSGFYAEPRVGRGGAGLKRRRPPFGGLHGLPARREASALAGLETRVGLADHEDLATTADHLAVAVTGLRRLQGGQDLHDETSANVGMERWVGTLSRPLYPPFRFRINSLGDIVSARDE